MSDVSLIRRIKAWLRVRVLARRVLIISSHAILYTAAFVGAYLLRFDFSLPEAHRDKFYFGLVVSVALRVFSGFVFRIYGGVLKYAGIKDLVDIVKAMSLATAAFVVVVVLLGFRGFPRSVIAIDWLASIMLVGGLRFGLRMAREALTAGVGGAERKRVLIIGAGDAGEALVRDVQRLYRDRYEVIGFLDDNRAKRGLRIHDVPVLGPLMYMGDFVARYQVDEVIIAIPTATGETMRRIVEISKVAGVRFKTIPGVDQLIDGTITVNQIRDVAIEDLLGREPVELEEGLIRQFLYQKVVMVTGAGGSIGAELCRQITRYLPRKLVLLEQAEPFLFAIHQELLETHPDLQFVPIIADVTDAVRLERVFSQHGPEVIFHAAAHKHVPMMEWNPGEAIKNNIFGTKTVADMANLFGARAFVMVSTDKAVNPTSIMGASKRVAEMYVQSLSDGSLTKFTAVRFGNVLGSVGSVVPIFKRQIVNGGPVTVTHPDMRRYFMTIPESCQLVMQAAAMGVGGEIFVLDMGEPVKIVDLASDLITLSGFEPEKDIEIVFTGLRPGEKLFEELGFDAEKMSKTRHPKVYIGKLTTHPLEEMSEKVRFLLGVADETRSEEIKAALKVVVPEYDTDVAPAQYPFEKHDRPGTSTLPLRPTVAFHAAASRVEPLPSTAGDEEPDRFEAHRGERSTSKPVEKTVVGDAPEPEMTSKETPEPGRIVGEPAMHQTGSLSQPKSDVSSRVNVREAQDDNAQAFDSGKKQNPMFDPIWEDFSELCREKGFAGVSWATMGVKPPDERKQFFDVSGDAERSVIRRSMPISSLAFLEVRFMYSGMSGRKTPEHFRQAVRDISARVTRRLLSIGRSVNSSSQE